MDLFYRVGNHSRLTGCYFIIPVTLLICLLIANFVILFFVENETNRGERNYCTVNEDAAEADFQSCAAASFNITKAACANVFPPVVNLIDGSINGSYIDV